MRPNNEISVHYRFFEVQAGKVKNAIMRLTKKDNPDENDILAIRGLLDVYADLTSNDIGAYFRHTVQQKNEGSSSTK